MMLSRNPKRGSMACSLLPCEKRTIVGNGCVMKIRKKPVAKVMIPVTYSNFQRGKRLAKTFQENGSFLR